MLDITPKLTLTSQQRKIYSRLRWALVLVTVFLALAFIHHILFPTATLYYGYKNIDPIFRLAQPATTDTATVFHGSSRRTTNEITLTLRSDIDLSGMSITIQKGHYAYLSTPYEETIIKDASDLPLSPGSLMMGTSGHALTALGGVRHPFDTVMTFEALGYDFADSQVVDSGIWNRYTRGHILNLQSVHPPGTRFVEIDNNNTVYQLSSTNTLTKITPDDLRSLVAVEALSRTTNDSCLLTKKAFRQDTYSCTTSINTITSFSGKDYVFSLDHSDASSIELERITITLKPAYSRQNVTSRLTAIRQALIP